jgi:hypothetical protein
MRDTAEDLVRMALSNVSSEKIRDYLDKARYYGWYNLALSYIVKNSPKWSRCLFSLLSQAVSFGRLASVTLW